MMMRAFFVIAVLLMAAPAQAASLKLELAQDQVDISTGFNGAQLALFGVSDAPDADVAVTLTGPEETVVVRKKTRVGGAWMNTQSIEFRRVPSYYDLALTRSSTELAEPAILGEHKIGMGNLGFYSEYASDDAQAVEIFRDSLINDMQQRGFYPLKFKTITFIEPTFFRIAFDLPPDVPTGIYTVKGLLLKDGKVIAQETRTLQVGQVGFNARIYNFANENPLFYGVFAILVALVAGWSAFTFLRRD